MTEALLGAGLVLLEHVARNQSSARGYSLSAHLINTLTLIACLTLTAWWASGHADVHLAGRPAKLAAFSLGLVMLLGVSGAIAALGDTLFPSHTLAEGFARDLDPAANIFLRLRILHPALAVLTAMWLAFYAVATSARRPDLRTHGLVVLGLLAAQVTAGLANLLLLAPVWMQIVHLLLADTLWISLIIFCAGILKNGPVSADKKA